MTWVSNFLSSSLFSLSHPFLLLLLLLSLHKGIALIRLYFFIVGKIEDIQGPFVSNRIFFKGGGGWGGGVEAGGEGERMIEEITISCLFSSRSSSLSPFFLHFRLSSFFPSNLALSSSTLFPSTGLSIPHNPLPSHLLLPLSFPVSHSFSIFLSDTSLLLSF